MGRFINPFTDFGFKHIFGADRETGLVFNPKFRQIYIELPRFKKEEKNVKLILNVGFMY